MRVTTPIAEHAIGEDGLLVVQVRSGDLRLSGVPGDTVRVHGAQEDLRYLTLEPGPGSLTIRVRGGRSPDLALDVPVRAAIVMEGASADVWGERLHGDQRYRTASGDVDLRDVHGSLSVEAVSGDVDIVADGPSAIAARTVSGDLAIRAGTLTTLRAGTTSGNLRIAGRFEGAGPFAVETVSGDATLAPAGGLRVEAATITGELRSDLPATTQGDRGRRTMTVAGGGPTLTFRSTSGDLRIVPAIELAMPVPPAPRSAPRQEPSPPTPPLPPEPVRVSVDDAAPPRDDAEQLRILRALERGEIDVAEARRRLDAIDADQATTSHQEADHVG